MEIKYIPKHGPHMSHPKGWSAEPGIGEYNHRFGGESWIVSDPNPIFGGPTLLLTLDLTDPKLSNLGLGEISELPLCSYINCDLWTERQEYRIDFEKKKVILENRSDSNYPPELELLLPNPLDEKFIKFKELKQNEYPVDETYYWKAYDEFLGGTGFIRIFGPPIWLQNHQDVKCSCKSQATYVAGVGYEFQSGDNGFIDQQPFFIGEGALYFFICPNCTSQIVVSQPIEV